MASVAAIMLCPQAAASATVYQDNNVNVPTITDTIQNEDFGANGNSQALSLTLWFTDLSSIDDLFISFAFGNDLIGGFTAHFLVNYNTSLINVSYILDTIGDLSNPEWQTQQSYPIATTGNQSITLSLRYNATSFVFLSVINRAQYIKSGSGLSIVDYSGHRYLSIFRSIIYQEFVNISEFTTSQSFGYGLMAYPVHQSIYSSMLNGDYLDGYSDGYSDGAEDWDSFIGWDWLKAAVSIIGTVLTIEIAPNIYLGYFVALPLILGAVMFVLQFKR